MVNKLASPKIIELGGVNKVELVDVRKVCLVILCKIILLVSTLCYLT